MASGSNAPFSGEFNDLENLPELPEGVSRNEIDQIRQFINDSAGFMERLDLEQSLNAFNYDDGFIDIFFNKNKITSSSQVSITTGSNGSVKISRGGISGFENGTDPFNFGGTIDSNSEINGTNSMKFQSSGTQNEFTGDLPQPISTQQTVKALVKIDNKPGSPSFDEIYVRILDSSGNEITRVGFDFDGDINIANEDALGTWNAGEIFTVEFDLNPSNNSATARVVGVGESTESHTFSQMKSWKFRNDASDSGATVNLFVDDLSTGQLFSTGTVTHTRKDLGFTPSSLVASPEFDASASNESVNMIVSDNSGNSVTLKQSDFDNEQSVDFEDGNLQIKMKLSGGGTSTPKLEKTMLLGVE